MANTYTQIHLQLIFAVKYREAVITNIWKNELYKYISGIIQQQKHKLIIVNGVAGSIRNSNVPIVTKYCIKKQNF